VTRQAPSWEHFEHQADIGVRGYGRSAAEAFEQAAVALTAVVADPTLVVPREDVQVVCAAPMLDLLLTDWLNALVTEMACRHMLFSRFVVRLDAATLSGDAWGEPVDRARHQPRVEVKGATYAGLRVAPTDEGLWVAQCIVDV
jgi:SHS2 domain-containing protein